MVFRLPMPPNLGNARMHWRVKLNAKHGYMRELEAIATAIRHGARLPAGMDYHIPPAPYAPWEKASIEAHMVLGGHMDDDNAMARVKWPLDWLRHRGYIQDDRRKHLRWAGLPEQEVTRKSPPLLTLTLVRL